MDGSTLPDLADLRAFHGARRCRLCDWPAELSITGVEGEAGCSQSQVFLVTPTGDQGTHLQVIHSVNYVLFLYHTVQ